MRGRSILSAAFVAALLVPSWSHASAAAHPAPRVALVRHDHVNLRALPLAHAKVLTVLVQQSQVELLGHRGSWSHVRVWASIAGWLESAEIVNRSPWPSVSTYHAPEVHYGVRAHGPRSIHAGATTTAPVTLQAAPGGALRGRLPANARVSVSAWQQDAAGKIWYRIGSRWVLGDAIQFRPPAVGSGAGGRPLASPVAGKGMWITLGTFATGDPDALARGAQSDGISHIYLESAISPLGFHGRQSVGAMIDAAHRRHIAVIAWVYPYLNDLASDVDLTRQVAAFRSPAGGRFDGIAADLERNVQLPNVRAYSQLVRAYLGPPYLLVGVTYPPQAFADYPFAEMARTYNVLAPMDYWHQTQTANGLDYGHMRYGFDYAERYAADSVAAIRRAAGPIPVSPIGQTFDNFGRLEMGPNAPSADEIRGFLSGSKIGGAIGASFFQWMTATDAEWRIIREYRY